MIKIKIKYFGIFSEYLKEISYLNLKDKSRLSDLRIYLIMLLEKQNIDKNILLLLNSAVFSNEDKILLDDYLLIDGDIIYLLPPVSGG